MHIELISQLAGLYLVVEALVSIFFSEDRRPISMFGRYVRILIGIVLMFNSIRRHR